MIFGDEESEILKRLCIVIYQLFLTTLPILKYNL
jgi:hypothetical protein